jgi:hypothetical protein
MTPEEKEQWEFVYYKKDAEGFNYCFTKYSSFPEIKDPEFHSLRLKYVQAAKELEQYIENKYNEEIDED